MNKVIMTTYKKECFLWKSVEVLCEETSFPDSIKMSFRECCEGHGEQCLLCFTCVQEIELSIYSEYFHKGQIVMTNKKKKSSDFQNLF